MANETYKFKSDEDLKPFMEKIQKDGLYEKGYMDYSNYHKTVTIDTEKVIDGKTLRTEVDLRGGEIVD